MAAPELFGERRVLFVMAVDAEYGLHLQRMFRPLFTGVGPVEAAVAVAAELARLAAAGALPELVVSLGSAGSRRLDHANVYQAMSVAYRDMDASALGFATGVTPFLDLPAVVPLPLRVPGIPEARLATGASVISGAAYDAIPADMVDMETYAYLRACQSFSVPVIALRGISDGKTELAGLSDWTDYLHLVDQRLAAAVARLAAAFANGDTVLGFGKRRPSLSRQMQRQRGHAYVVTASPILHLLTKRSRRHGCGSYGEPRWSL